MRGDRGYGVKDVEWTQGEEAEGHSNILVAV